MIHKTLDSLSKLKPCKSKFIHLILFIFKVIALFLKLYEVTIHVIPKLLDFIIKYQTDMIKELFNFTQKLFFLNLITKKFKITGFTYF